MLAGWTRAILLQVAHPLIAAGVVRHSSFRDNPGLVRAAAASHGARDAGADLWRRGHPRARHRRDSRDPSPCSRSAERGRRRVSRRCVLFRRGSGARAVGARHAPGVRAPGIRRARRADRASTIATRTAAEASGRGDRARRAAGRRPARLARSRALPARLYATVRRDCRRPRRPRGRHRAPAGPILDADGTGRVGQPDRYGRLAAARCARPVRIRLERRARTTVQANRHDVRRVRRMLPDAIALWPEARKASRL